MATALHSLSLGPEPFDLIAVGVDPLWAGSGCLMPLRRDRRLGAHAPDVLTEAVARVASVTHNPLRYSRQLLQQGEWRVGVHVPGPVQMACGSSCAGPGAIRKGDGPPCGVGDHASLGAIAATRSPKRFTIISLSLRSPFRLAPAAFWCARTFVPPRNTIPSCTPRS